MTPATKAKRLVTFWGTHGSILTPGQITEKHGGKNAKKSVYLRECRKGPNIAFCRTAHKANQPLTSPKTMVSGFFNSLVCSLYFFNLKTIIEGIVTT